MTIRRATNAEKGEVFEDNVQGGPEIVFFP